MKNILRYTPFLLLLLAGCGTMAGSSPTAIPTAAARRAIGAAVFEGHVVPRQSASLFFYTTGAISEIVVKQGDIVKQGDVLARLGDREAFTAAVTAAQLEQSSAQRQIDDLTSKAALMSGQAQAAVTAALKDSIAAAQKLADLDTEAHQAKVDTANTDISKAKDDLKTASEDFDKVKDLSLDNASRKSAKTKFSDAQKKYDDLVRARDLLVNEVEDARVQVALTKARLADAQKTRDDTAAGPNPKDLALANDRLANAKAQLASAQAALKRLDLVAPFAGTVAKVDHFAGEQVTPGTPVIELADTSTWYVETNDLTETDVVAVSKGQKASLNPDALPEVTLIGSVENIGQTFVEKAGNINYTVRILVEKPDPALRWGMTVNVRFVK